MGSEEVTMSANNPPTHRRASRSLTLRPLVIALTFALVLASCASDDDGDAASDTTVAETTETTAPDDTTPTDPYEVTTDLGPVIGTTSDVEGVRAFLTIPFAAPPTEDNRFRAPRPHPGWDDPLEATELGASCPQPTDGVTAAFLDIPEPDEDCLTLNVWTPEQADGLPVMVWIHGGGLSTGSAHQPYYIGDQLAGNDVVLVSMNYRMGALGFLATDELAGESDDGSFGNYGLADQTAALEWVARNAEAFGGDPDDVTIFGESAGGFSVCAHLASEHSRSLFTKAAILSGGGCDRFLDADDALAAGADYLEALGCDDIECARALPVEDLIDAAFSPVLVADGVTLDRTARDLAAAGELDVPLLTGANADEATLFTIGLEVDGEDGLIELVGSLSDDPEAVLELYPAEDFATDLARYQAIWTDARFVCPSVDFASVTPETYLYHYTYISPGNPFGLGATHGAELAFLFGHPEGIVGLEAELDEETEQVAADIQDAFTRFAKNGVPGEGWTIFAETGDIMLLDRPFEVTDEIRGGRCTALVELTNPR